MSWLWFAGPLFFLFALLAVSLWPTSEERRLRATIERWIDGFLGPLPAVDGKTRVRRVRALPRAFHALVDEAGGGTRVTDVVLVPKHAYLAVRAADALTSTNFVTVLFRLEAAGPRFTCKPVPIVDGRPADNKGLPFEKDPYFAEAFWVDGADAKKVRRWLKKGIRRRLMEVPEAWLRVRGRTASLTVYGSPDEALLEALVDAADEMFAAHGSDPEASLFGDTEPQARGYRRVAKGNTPPDAEGSVADGTVATRARMVAGAIDVGLYVLAGLFLALAAGALPYLHQSSYGPTFFNSPDLVTDEPWQGGWTTKGFGLFVLAESLLACLFILQSYWVSVHGSTFGGRLMGVRITREGRAPGFFRGVVLRSWIYAAVPLGVAFATAASPRTAAAFFAALTSRSVGLAAAGTLVAVAASTAVGGARNFRDRIAGTQVLPGIPLRLPAIQLGQRDGVDPIARRRAAMFGGLFVAFLLVNVVAAMADVSFWIY